MPDVNAALVAMNPKNGALEALVGGFSFELSKFNRVDQARRQIGSNINPFLYATALEHGYTLASLINDAPINQWDPSKGPDVAAQELTGRSMMVPLRCAWDWPSPRT
ncbi:hypothetical protein ACF2JD_03970 [Aeromonas sp. A-5]|uniref:hypothetical protein n=1 Tax=Aeromonas ichthyocola TaxID=3367746 RepID=UPI0038EF0043